MDIAKTVYPSLNDVYLKFFDNSNDQGMRGRKSEDCQEEEELIGFFFSLFISSFLLSLTHFNLFRNGCSWKFD